MNQSFIIVLLFACFSSFQASTTRISWRSAYQLRWENFEGKPDYNDSFKDAITVSAIKFTVGCNNNNTLYYSAQAEFLPNQSWVKPIAKTDYHLNHEQFHFNITELYVRKLREALSYIEPVCENEQLVQEIANDFMHQCSLAQAKYDHETKFSLHKKKQANWETQILQQLQEKAAYATKEK